MELLTVIISLVIFKDSYILKENATVSADCSSVFVNTRHRLRSRPSPIGTMADEDEGLVCCQLSVDY